MVVANEYLTLGDNADSTGATFRSPTITPVTWAGPVTIAYDSAIESRSSVGATFLFTGGVDIQNCATLRINDTCTCTPSTTHLIDVTGAGGNINVVAGILLLSGTNTYSGTPP